MVKASRKRWRKTVLPPVVLGKGGSASSVRRGAMVLRGALHSRRISVGGRREAVYADEGCVHVVEHVRPDLTDVCGIAVVERDSGLS